MIILLLGSNSRINISVMKQLKYAWTSNRVLCKQMRFHKLTRKKNIRGYENVHVLDILVYTIETPYIY